jgi:tripartite-type tricarboxylate transporter receptor subunit TctC
MPARLLASFLTLIATVALAAAASAAEPYPTRPVKWIVGYPAGGSNDIVARIVGQYLSDRMGQQVVVENRPGDSNNLATKAVISAAPDGYTLLFVNAANVINTSLYPNLPFDFLRDIEPVVGIMRVPNVMEVHPSVPARTVAEFITYAKANPGRLNMASSGTGTSIHLAGEMFKSMAGVDMVHIPYKGTPPAITDTIAGHVQVIFDNLPSSMEHIRSGRLRPLGVTTAERSSIVPDLPSIAETVPGYESSSLFGVGVPKGTPPEVIERLNREVNAALADPAIRQRLVDLGGILIGGTADAFRRLLVEDTERWAKVIKAAGVKLE